MVKSEWSSRGSWSTCGICTDPQNKVDTMKAMIVTGVVIGVVGLVGVVLFLARPQKPPDLAWGVLQEGMSKQEVANLIGKPHNVDNDVVWMWLSMPPDEQQPFRNMFTAPGRFVLFDAEGKLATLAIKNVESHPWEAYQHAFKVTRHTAEQVLGESFEIQEKAVP